MSRRPIGVLRPAQPPEQDRHIRGGWTPVLTRLRRHRWRAQADNREQRRSEKPEGPDGERSDEAYNSQRDHGRDDSASAPPSPPSQPPGYTHYQRARHDKSDDGGDGAAVTGSLVAEDYPVEDDAPDAGKSGRRY